MGLELAKAFVRVSADSSQLSSGLGQARAITEQEMTAIAASVAGILTAVSAAGTAFTSLGVSSAAWAEQNQIAFGTMLGSAEAATKLLSELDTFAATTPFQLPGIVKAGKVLLAFGVDAENLVPTMKTLGDVAAGTGKDFAELSTIFGQVRAAGKLTGERMNQFVEAGIPLIRVLAEQFGVAESEIRTLGTAGKISFKDVEKAFQSMSGEGGQFFDMMTAQSASLTGLQSTMKDNFDLLARTIGEPIAAAMKPVVAITTRLFQTLSAMAGAFPEIASGAVLATTAVSGLTAAIILATIAAKAMGLTVKQAMRSVLIASGVGIAFVAIGAAIGVAVGAAMALFKWIKNLEPVQVALERNAEKFRKAWEIIKTVVGTAVGAITAAIATLLNTFTPLEGIPATIGGLFSALIDTVAEFVLDTAEWFQVLVGDWETTLEFLKASFVAAWSFMKDVAGNFFEALPQIAAATWNAILVGFNEFVSSIGAGAGRLLELFGAVGTGIAESLVAALKGQGTEQAIVKAAGRIAGIMGEQLSDMPDIMAAGNALTESLGGLNLLEPSPETAAAVSKAAGLFGKLAFEKAKLEADRDFGAGAGEEGGKEGGEDDPVVAALEKIEFGRQDFPSFSRTLQDGLLKQTGEQAKILAENEKQTAELKKIEGHTEKSATTSQLAVLGP